jgi:hypothetical protein
VCDPLSIFPAELVQLMPVDALVCSGNTRKAAVGNVVCIFQYLNHSVATGGAIAPLDSAAVLCVIQGAQECGREYATVTFGAFAECGLIKERIIAE